MENQVESVIFPLPLPKEIAEYEGLISALPKARRDKILRAPEGKKAQSLSAYLCLISAVKNKTGSLLLPEFSEGSFTRLTCGLYANISHTDTAVMAAVSTAPVGVDVQTFRPVEEKVILRALGEREAKTVLASPDIPSAFALAWAKKEALYKAHGVGLNGIAVSDNGYAYQTGLGKDFAYAICYQLEE
ncbi:MAG: 4'-phosphopantetheinyl transferase superfamily protein [Clostridia bacterium]|nr:4'-phosphopantetheinyl transferase superfamily protein [Clostridia bacterium]